MAAIGVPDATYLRECFDYDPETGLLTWKHRPREHFENDHRWHLWLANYAGKKAGTTSDRYQRVIINLRGFYAHRVIWAMQTGAWPGGEVDHKNQNKIDNRWDNLRLATHQDNMRNRNGWSGRDLPKGVTRHRKRYVACCAIDYRSIYIGIFKTPEEAHAAYRTFVSTHHGEFLFDE